MSFRSGVELNNHSLLPVTDLDGLWSFTELCNSVMLLFAVKHIENYGVPNLPGICVIMGDIGGVKVVNYDGSPMIIDEILQDASSQLVPDIITNLATDVITIRARRKIFVLQVHYFVS